jgi:hypothetical protein
MNGAVSGGLVPPRVPKADETLGYGRTNIAPGLTATHHEAHPLDSKCPYNLGELRVWPQVMHF